MHNKSCEHHDLEEAFAPRRLFLTQKLRCSLAVAVVDSSLSFLCCYLQYISFFCVYRSWFILFFSSFYFSMFFPFHFRWKGNTLVVEKPWRYWTFLEIEKVHIDLGLHLPSCMLIFVTHNVTLTGFQCFHFSMCATLSCPCCWAKKFVCVCFLDLAIRVR